MFLNWIKMSLTSNETRYTKLPEGLIEEYMYVFSKQYIVDKYEGNVLQACEENPTLFTYYMLGVKLRPEQYYMQKEMMDNKFLLSIWGRRMGKSLTFKTFIAWAIANNRFPQGADNTTKVIVIAHTQESADGYIDDIRQMFITGDRVVEDRFKGKLGNKYFSVHLPNRNSKIKDKANHIGFFNNGWNKIKTFPPTTRARGEPASLIIMDELAFWKDYTSLTKDEYAIYNEVIRPIPTDNPKARIYGATTPNGMEGLAYDLMPIDGHKTRYKLIWFPYYYRNDPEYLAEMEETEKEYLAQGREKSFRQEYLAELITKSNSYFTEDEINNVFSDKRLNMVMASVLPVNLGLDFGGSAKSRTVITLSYNDEENNKLIRIYHKRYPLQEDSTLQQDLIELSKRFNIKKYYVDSQGGGSAFYSWFRKTFGEEMIEEVVFRTEKVDMYRLFKIACYQDKIKSYFDTDLLEEMHAFTADLKPTRSKTDDLLDSFVLSVKEWLRNDDLTTSIGIIKY